MGIQEVASELYGLPPEEFTAARNAAAAEAKSSGDAELAAAVKVLRKPSVGAWLLNQLVRQHEDEVGQVLELGARLRAAQGTLGAAGLRALDTQRRALTRAVAGQAVAIGQSAGRSVSASVTAAVEETLRSAMVDTEAGTALSSGLLVDTFSASGLEPVDLSRVVAVGGATPRAGRSRSGSATPSGPDPAAVAAARRAVEAAEAALRSAQSQAEAARQAGVAARRRRDEVGADLEKARQAVEALEERLSAAVSADEDARRAQHTATRDERSAVEAAQKAQRALDRLLDG
ncbi:hypothetical protein G7075_14080 [Phycicoccus sp. HDW14]|uniref:hypothetical protein n=1 Tax=Phycicoccus sp. HDW14 TaxID=2714941 RepID=UPI00140CA7C5|nr:hypothetical protein [Phycicoccus sp. HDW14]QIM22000.1 hypothetical protein G7075_14080 [Phycicoccus sp. HDW14]